MDDDRKTVYDKNADEGGAPKTLRDQEKAAGAQKTTGEAAALTPDQIKEQEAAAGASSQTTTDETTGPSDQVGRGFNPGKAPKSKKLSKFIRKHKVLAGVGGLGGLVFLGFVFFVIFFLGSLKTVHFSTVLRSAGFARFNLYNSREFAQTAFDSAVLSEGSTGSLVLKDGGLVSKLKRVNTEKQLKDLGRSDTLKFNTEKVGGDTIVNGMQIKGENVSLDDTAERLFGKKASELSIRERWTAESDFVNTIKTSLADELSVEGRLFRSGVYDGVRQAFGIRMTKWVNDAKDMLGKSPAEAEKEELKNNQQEVESGANVSSELDTVNEQAKALKDFEDAEIAKGISPTRAQINDFVSTKLVPNSDALRKASLAVAAVTLACIAHDINKSINEVGQRNEAQAARLGHDTLTGGAQIEKGDVVAEAVGAENATWDGAENAAFYKQDTGQPVDAASEKQLDDVPSIGSKPIPVLNNVDQFLRAFVTLGASSYTAHIPIVGHVVKNIGDQEIKDSCNVALSQVFQYGLAGVEITSVVLTSFVDDGASAAIQAGLKEAFVFGTFVVGGDQLGQALNKYVASIGGADFSGASSGIDKYNQTQVGVNALEQYGNKQISYGRPMTAAEATASNETAMQDLRDSYGKKSISERYFAISNPYSLAGNLAADVPTGANNITSSVGSFITSGIFNSLKSLGSVFGSIIGGRHLAYAESMDIAANHSYFGVDQWGWSNEELAKMSTDESFSPVELSQIVEPNLDTLNAKYQPCYDHVKQSDEPKTGCSAVDLSSDEALHWRAYMAESYAADRLSEDLTQ